MNNFSIYTICTENYKDAIDFLLPSWLRLKSVDKIYIYTDFDLSYDNERVVVLNKINKTDDWLKIVGLKSILLDDFLSFYNEKYFAFIDIDCYIVKDVSSIFDKDFDVAATRMNSKKVANSGVWFCKNTENTKRFANEWMNLQKEYKNKKIGVKKHNSSYSQRSFSFILHREYKNKTYLNVLPVDVNKYNYEDDDVDKWVNDIIKHNPYILHFKGRRWRDKSIINKVFKYVY